MSHGLGKEGGGVLPHYQPVIPPIAAGRGGSDRASGPGPDTPAVSTGGKRRSRCNSRNDEHRPGRVACARPSARGSTRPRKASFDMPTDPASLRGTYESDRSLEAMLTNLPTLCTRVRKEPPRVDETSRQVYHWIETRTTRTPRETDRERESFSRLRIGWARANGLATALGGDDPGVTPSLEKKPAKVPDTRFLGETATTGGDRNVA